MKKIAIREDGKIKTQAVFNTEVWNVTLNSKNIKYA